MSIVWIANYAGHPYDQAEKFGELRYLTRGYVSLGNLDRLVYDVAEKVAETKAEDYLLLSGLCVVGVIASVAWVTMWGGVKILHWDKNNSDYVPLEFTRGQLEKMFDVFLIREAEDKWRTQNE